MKNNREVGLELAKLAGKVGAINLNPFLTRAKKLDKVLAYLSSLDDDVMGVAVPTLLEDYNIYGDKQFPNTERQLESIVKKYPKLNYCKNMLRERIKIGRQKALLPT